MSIHLQLLEPESATKIATLVNILKKLVRVFTILGTATKNLGSVLLFPIWNVVLELLLYCIIVEQK